MVSACSFNGIIVRLESERGGKSSRVEYTATQRVSFKKMKRTRHITKYVAAAGTQFTNPKAQTLYANRLRYRGHVPTKLVTTLVF